MVDLTARRCANGRGARARRRDAVPLLLLGCLGCSRASPAPAASDPVAAAGWPPFAARGRWPAPRHLTFAVATTDLPVAAAVFERAVARAMATWQATGIVGFVAATSAADADVTVACRLGNHGACEPFGSTTAIAHSGPVVHGTFVHLDAARPWDEDRLFRTALHELGHVLGLDHSVRADAVMANGDPVPDHLGQPDLDGLHSLYGGGGAVGAADLAIVAADGTVATVLRGILGPNTAHAAFDVDGDGAEDLVVWRTDAAGNGAMCVYHFTAGPQLATTSGPFLGVVLPGMTVAFARTAHGERLLLATRANGRMTVLAFDPHGVPLPQAAALPDLDLQQLARTRAPASSSADFDGDGRRETFAPGAN